MKLEQPNWPRFLPSRLVTGVATLGPLGRRMPAPGTWGSAAGVLYFTVAFYSLDWLGMAFLGAIGVYVAAGFCGEAEFRIGRKDPGEVILDEFVAMPLCFFGWRSLLLPTWAVCLLGFALFRFFDILKPLGIRRLERQPAGWGIVLDDVGAALAACATMHLGAWVWLLAHR